MGSLRYLRTCIVVIGALALLIPSAALAQGAGPSAGDQQYVDPLSGSSASGSSSHSSGSSSSSSGSASSSSSSSSSSSGSSSGSSSTSGTSSSHGSSSGGQSSGSTLPFTGLNLWACAAVGVVLVGSGLALRRTVRST